MKTKFLRVFSVLFALLLVVSLFSGCQKNNDPTEQITSVNQFTTQRVGVQAGTLYEENLVKMCPGIQISYFTIPTDMLVALEQGKIDSFLIEDVTYEIQKKPFPWLTPLDGSVLTTPVGAAISQYTRHPMLQQELEEFVELIQTNGVMDELKSYWFSGFDPAAQKRIGQSHKRNFHRRLYLHRRPDPHERYCPWSYL